MKALSSNSLYIVSLLMAIGMFALDALSQTYNEYFGKAKTNFSYSETKSGKEIKIVLTRKDRVEICFLDSNYSCLKWVYKNSLNGNNFTAIRTLYSIHIVGNRNGSEFNSNITIGNQPWFQFWEYGIARMISSGKSEMAFASIDGNKPNNAATFLVKKHFL